MSRFTQALALVCALVSTSVFGDEPKGKGLVRIAGNEIMSYQPETFSFDCTAEYSMLVQADGKSRSVKWKSAPVKLAAKKGQAGLGVFFGAHLSIRAEEWTVAKDEGDQNLEAKPADYSGATIELNPMENMAASLRLSVENDGNDVMASHPISLSDNAIAGSMTLRSRGNVYTGQTFDLKCKKSN